MKALVFTALAAEPTASFCQIVSRDTPDPAQLPTHALLIQVAAAGFNYADVLQRAGKYALRPQKKTPYTPGLEASGTVIAIGNDVTRFCVGDRIAALLLDGRACAEHCVVHQDMCVRVPDSWGAAHAAALPLNYLTAWIALVDQARVRRGEWVLVTAAPGGVGTAAVALALQLGAKVCAVSSSREKLTQLAQRFPIDAAVEYQLDDLAKFRDAVKAETGAGTGPAQGAVHVLLDGVGGLLFDAACDCLAPFGRAVSYGLASGAIPANHAVKLIVNQIAMFGVNVDLVSKLTPHRIASNLQKVVHTLQAPPSVGQVFDFSAEGAQSAIDNLETISPSKPGKLVLEIGPTSSWHQNHPEPEKSPEKLHTERHMVKTRFGFIHAIVISPTGVPTNKRPLVCLHMTPRSSDEYLEFSAIMATKHHCPTILIDTLGYGCSDQASTVLPMTAHAEHIKEVLDSVAPSGKVDIFGHLSGACMAVEFAVLYPERVQYLYLLDLLLFDSQLRARIREWCDQPTHQLDFDSPSLLNDIAKKREASTTRKLNLRCIIDELKAGGEGTSHASVSQYEIEKRLPILQSHTVLISGSEARKLFDNMGWKATENSAALEKMIPKVETHVISGGTLFVCNTHPDKVADIVAATQL